VRQAAKRDLAEGADSLPRQKRIAGRTPWELIALGISAVLSLVVLCDHSVFSDRIGTWLGSDLFKIVAQFLFITMLGGIVFVLLKTLSEEVQKREARQAAKRDLAKETDGLYRSVKHIKRMLRMHMRLEGDVIRIPKNDFEKRMEELDKLQISIEQGVVAIRGRTDLMSDEVRERIYGAVRYAARYLHDVVQEFEQDKGDEHGTVKLDGESYIVDRGCVMLQDFLTRVEVPPNVASMFNKMRRREDDQESRDGERWEAFRAINDRTRANVLNAAEASGERTRYRVVAQECFSMAVSELVRSATP
jgi:hypothetical protein